MVNTSQWKVVSIKDIMIGSPLEGAKRGHRVTYQTSNGVVSYVDVPLTEYTADKVQQLINNAVAVHDDVLGLDNMPNTPTFTLTP